MDYLFSGEESKMKMWLSAGHSSMIAHAINIAPFVLAIISGLLAIATVKMFRTTSNLSDESAGADSDVDGTISILLSMLFSVEVGTRLIAVSDARYKMEASSLLMTVRCKAFFKWLAVKVVETQTGMDSWHEPLSGANHTEKATVELTDSEFESPAVSTFIAALYSSASLNRLKNTTHLRWVLFDLVIFYHVVIRAYAIATIPNITDLSVFTMVFTRSYLHYFVVMLMFSTSENIYQMYAIDKVSDSIPAPAKNVYECLAMWLKNRKEERFEVKVGKKSISRRYEEPKTRPKPV